MTFSDLFLVLRNPKCWTTVGDYSHILDDRIRQLLDSEEEIKPELDTFGGCFYAEWGGTRFWVANRPYSCFKAHDCRPSRASMIRASKVLERVLFKSEEK